MSATGRSDCRKPNDLYETPSYTVDSLMQVLDFTNVKSFLEPCKASGNIYNQVPCNHKIYTELSEGLDYLKTQFSGKFDLIITNPPFSIAQEFLEKSLNEGRSVWYLLRINFLESATRSEWWQDRAPTHLLALSARPSFTGKGTDATAYAWFGWDYTNVCKLKPGIHVLPYNKPNKRKKKV